MGKILTVLHKGAPELMEVCDPVSKFDDRLAAFAELMKKNLVEYSGVGLAAPQLGITIRMIVARIKGELVVMVNPAIVRSSGIQCNDEGCLSLPGRVVRKIRKKDVIVGFQDCDGKRQMMKLSGFPAAIVQHEIDHLEGKMIA